MANKNLSFTICLVILLGSCASKKELEVISKDKDVIVSIYNPENSNYEVIGKTPLKINSNKLKQLQSSEYLNLKLSKAGFVSENYLVSTEGRDKLKVVSNLQNVPDWTAPASENSSLVANEIVTNTQSINQMIKNAKYQQALSRVDKLLKRFPKAHILYDLRGSILLLKGERSRSIASFEKSLILNPINEQTKRVLSQLKKGKQ